MSPFKVLGLTRRASLVEVKRAYARLLKRHRPDEDPVAFQRIHEAFEACVARCRERDAREREQALAAVPAEGPDGAAAAEEDDHPYAFPAEAHDEDEDAPGAYAPETADETRAAPSPRQADELEHLVRETLAHLESDEPQALYAWLAGEERLYPLSRKRAVSERVLAHASVLEDLDWRRWDAVFRFFEVDSVADPRLRNDYFAHRLWLQVRADERFQHQLEVLRAGRHDTFADRLLMRELLDPPEPGRTLLLLAVPGLANRLRARYDELAAADLPRTEAVVSPRMHSLWLPLTDPGRLDWRRFATAYLQAAVVCGGVIGLFSLSANNDLARYLRITGVTLAILAVPWTAWTLLRWGWRRYIAWRGEAYGEGEAPVGAPVHADQLSVLVLTGLACVLGTWALAWRAQWQGPAFLFHGFALLVGLRMVAGDDQRQRWDAYLLWLALSACLWRLFSRWSGAEFGWDASFIVPASASAVGLLVIADFLEARRRGISVAEARTRVGWVHLALVVAAVPGFVALLL